MCRCYRSAVARREGTITLALALRAHAFYFYYFPSVSASKRACQRASSRSIWSFDRGGVRERKSQSFETEGVYRRKKRGLVA